MKRRRTVINDSLDESLIDNVQLKQKELQILSAFIAVCDELNLKYFLAGGTLLGAIRHKGFIPWDDDIDVCMPRDDYDLFLKNAYKYLPEHLFVQTHYSDPDYRQPFAKIRDSNTTYIETSSQMLNINHGIFIDIFPIDGLPDNNRKINHLLRYKKVVMTYLGKDYYPRTFRRAVFGFIAKCLLFAKTPQSALCRFEVKIKKYSYTECKKTILYGGAWGKKEIHDKDLYGDGATATFEGLKVVVPANYDCYLTELYGDYMKMPPIEKRIGHHFCCRFDLNQSYKKAGE